MNKLDFNQKSIQVVLQLKRLKKRLITTENNQHLDGVGDNDKRSYDVNDDVVNDSDRKSVENFKKTYIALNSKNHFQTPLH